MPSSPQFVGQFTISNGGEIIAIGDLDRETKANYTFEVRASDLDPVHPRHNTTVVEIEVLDFNDNPPVFRNESYTVDVKEHSDVGFVAIKVRKLDWPLRCSSITRLVSQCCAQKVACCSDPKKKAICILKN